MVPPINPCLLKNCTSNPELRIKQYKHIRDVLNCQGYIAAIAAFGSCLVYEVGSKEFR